MTIEKPERVAASKLASVEWDKLCPILIQRRVLTEADGEALANLCMDMAILHEAQSGLTETGILLKGKNGIAVNPLIAIIRDTSARVSAGSREFGLTPGSRNGKGQV